MSPEARIAPSGENASDRTDVFRIDSVGPQPPRGNVPQEDPAVAATGGQHLAVG